jgi:hypothetical protein
MCLLLTLEANALFFVAYALMCIKSSNNGAEIHSAGVCRKSTFASSIATATSSTIAFTTLMLLGTFSIGVVKRAALSESITSWVASSGQCIPCTARKRRIRYEVVQKLLYLYERHVVHILLEKMRLHQSLKLEIRFTIDEANVLEIIRKICRDLRRKWLQCCV